MHRFIYLVPVLAPLCSPALAQTSPADGSNSSPAQSSATGSSTTAREPKVTVEQFPPDVTVNRGTPEVVVRQPAATVTIDIPQPEIIIRLPKPDVDVATSRPNVIVTPKAPGDAGSSSAQTDTQATDKAAVDLTQTSHAKPDVKLDNMAQPKITYERAEPRVVVKRQPGQPKVTIETLGDKVAATPDSAVGEAEPPAQAMSVATNAPKAGETSSVSVSRLADRSLYDESGKVLGKVEKIVRRSSGGPAATITPDARLGLGAQSRLVPLDSLELTKDRLVAHGVSGETLKKMQAADGDTSAAQTLSSSDKVDVRTSAN